MDSTDYGGRGPIRGQAATKTHKKDLARSSASAIVAPFDHPSPPFLRQALGRRPCANGGTPMHARSPHGTLADVSRREFLRRSAGSSIAIRYTPADPREARNSTIQPIVTAAGVDPTSRGQSTGCDRCDSCVLAHRRAPTDELVHAAMLQLRSQRSDLVGATWLRRGCEIEGRVPRFHVLVNPVEHSLTANSDYALAA
jgi:hypothetical protein